MNKQLQTWKPGFAIVCGTCVKILQDRVHTKGEGDEQGNAMMLLLFSLGQHSALQKVQVFAVTMPERVREVHRVLEENLQQARSPM